MGRCWMRCGAQRRKLQHSANSVVSCSCNAGVAELADALDSKSSTRKSVWVRTPPPVWFSTCPTRLPVRQARAEQGCSGRLSSPSGQLAEEVAWAGGQYPIER